MSGLFLPTRRSSAVKADRCLPEPAVSFCSSHLPNFSGDMAFHLLDNKVVATDTTGGAVLYDHDKQAVRALPSHEWLKNNVVSHTVGNSLYAHKRHGHPASLHGKWHWQTLPPPPPLPGVEDAADDPTSIDSFAAADDEGSKIWVSATGSGDVKGCTHLFDAERLAWSKEPADWVLPFRGCAEYAPELNKLWEHGCLLCASDLSSASKSQPPALHKALPLEETAARAASDGYDLISARAIYLGSGKFCVARIFATPMRITLLEEEGEQFAVMAGVEVTSSDGGRKVSMVERNSERYVLNDDDIHWVL
ncbi:hypothetical protein C2845_PM13G25730 [Panicum miliaceum]|uniref:Uncharacterized protein n=1 Tax=Panicum miliaceum TaxID=4540 RepID=A0A3L6RHZ1_PANMI|nr:hypothetical protein C2845_PM13G25730 [Panicum miliaceum]